MQKPLKGTRLGVGEQQVAGQWTRGEEGRPNQGRAKGEMGRLVLEKVEEPVNLDMDGVWRGRECLFQLYS